MKFILVSPKNRTAYNFRGDLIKQIISKGYEVIVTGPNRDNVEKIEALGARFEEIPMNKNGVNPIKDMEYEKALSELFKREKPDVVLSYTAKPVIYGTVAAKRAKVKSVNAMITGLGYAFTAKTLKARIIKIIMSVLYKISLCYADTVIFQNPDDMKQFTSSRLVKKNKCRLVAGSGVNTEKFHPMPYPEMITFFMLSRVMYSKGIREYLEAAKIVKKKYPGAEFMLLGACENIQDSISREKLQEYIDDGTVTYYGESEDIPPYYAKCSVYVLPSYREGTPRTILEAMACARPILTTDTPGCRETVIPGKNGFLVPVKDTQALAKRMIWFIENSDHIEEMGQKSLEYCLEKFEVGKVNSDMIKYCNI